MSSLGRLALTFLAVAFAPISSASASTIALGYSHACALNPQASVSCWGHDGEGQLGDGRSDYAGFQPRASRVPSGAPQLPSPVPGTENATAVAAGSTFTCALIKGGTVTCWGNARQDERDHVPPKPTTVAGVLDAVAITANGQRACAQLQSGTMSCWSPGYWPAKTVPGLDDVVAIDGTCALRRSGLVACLATDGYDDDLSTLPTPDIGPATWASGSDGGRCAVLSGGSVSCWSRDGTVLPIAIQQVTTMTRSVAHACAIVAGAVSCWGRNSGQIGLELEGAETTDTPQRIPGLDDAVELATSPITTCARRSNGAIKCWGNGGAGQLGDGTGTPLGELTSGSTTPVDVLDLSGVAASKTILRTATSIIFRGYVVRGGRYVESVKLSVSDGKRRITAYVDARAQRHGKVGVVGLVPIPASMRGAKHLVVRTMQDRYVKERATPKDFTVGPRRIVLTQIL